MKRLIAEASAGLLAVTITALFVLILFGGMGIAAVFGHGWFVDHTANRTGKTQMEQQINGNGSYRIAAYNHFYDLCAGVQTKEASIANLKAELPTDGPDRKPIVQASITALENQRADDINTYNADAHKSDTLAQFRASDLPFQLDPTEDHTTCSAS